MNPTIVLPDASSEKDYINWATLLELHDFSYASFKYLQKIELLARTFYHSAFVQPHSTLPFSADEKTCLEWSRRKVTFYCLYVTVGCYWPLLKQWAIAIRVIIPHISYVSSVANTLSAYSLLFSLQWFPFICWCDETGMTKKVWVGWMVFRN